MNSVIKTYRSFGSKVLVALLLYTVCRLLFYAFNYRYFSDLDLMVWIGGLRYDWMSISIIYLPFAFSFLFFYRNHIIPKIFFHLSSILSIIANVVDLEYFKFTFKRTTFDLLTTKGIGADIASLAPQFVIDYWYLFIIAVILFWGSFKLYDLSCKYEVPKSKFLPHLFLFCLPAVFLWGVGFRGGVQYRPLSVMQASKYSKAANIPLVVNTSFTLIKSYNKPSLELSPYFAEEKLDKIYSPILEFKGDSTPVVKENVVLFILESFSKEYIGALSKNKGYTPFLDSLINESLVFENAFANGKKSIEALPAILSSIPSLMNNSYISGKYGSNKIESVGSVLADEGYETIFYHGGANGTMGFDAFSQIAGIENYVGADEYPNKKDHDGNWGIFDEPFLQFTAEDLAKRNEPFFATIFTLSSHHPYPIPEEYQGKFPTGELPILESIAYSDFALKQFFEKAKTMDWFENTLFIFTADHTAQSMSTEYGSRVGIYSIPLIFYKNNWEKKGNEMRIVQQADIFPTVVDYLGMNKKIVAFGNSAFDTTSVPFAVNYINDTYQLIQGDYSLEFDGEKTIAVFNFKEDPILSNNLINQYPELQVPMEDKLKAIIQQYQFALINNQLSPR